MMSNPPQTTQRTASAADYEYFCIHCGILIDSKEFMTNHRTHAAINKSAINEILAQHEEDVANLSIANALVHFKYQFVGELEKAIQNYQSKGSEICELILGEGNIPTK